MTYGQLGIVDGVGFGFALVLEIPTGAIGDLLGKKKTLIFSTLASTIGVFTITFAHSMSGIFIGWIVSQLGYALFSGNGEALLYDTMKELGKEDKFDKTISKVDAISMYTFAITALIGGFLYKVNIYLPHILWGVGYLLAFFLTFFLVEPKIDTIKFSFKNYFRQLSVGAKELFQPALRKYMFFALFLVGVYYMYSWGFIKPALATSFGFYSESQGIITAIMAVVCAVVIRFIPYFRKKISDLAGLILLLVLMAVGFIGAYFPIGYWGVLVLIVITLGGSVASPWISAIINKDIESKYRATTLSTMAFIAKIPYVLLAVIAGNLIQQGNLRYFNLGIGLVLVVCIIFGLAFFTRKNKKTSEFK